MPDREKVIKGLEETYQYYSVVEGQGILIDKRNGDEYALIDPELITDALALLKAQEAVEPIQKQSKHGWFFYCPKCKTILNDMAKPKYCSECGQAVKWE